MAQNRRGDVGAQDPRREQQPGRELLSAADVTRTIARIAHQIIEKTAFGPDGAENVVLLGIPTRGVHVAHRLTAAIADFTGVAPAVGSVDATLYRDDLRRGPARALESTAMPEGGVDDKLVVLVDDVLMSGRTTRAALDALRDEGRPRSVQLAVLIDRGHRELPIRADYVGKNVPTSRSEQILVSLAETDGSDGVWIAQGESGPDSGGPQSGGSESGGSESGGSGSGDQGDGA